MSGVLCYQTKTSSIARKHSIIVKHNQYTKFILKIRNRKNYARSFCPNLML